MIQTQLDTLVSAMIAIVLCGILGWERESAGKAAGIRTHMLIGLASALFVGLGELLVREAQATGGNMQYDPIRVLEAVVTGISFLGAGTIFFARRGTVEGLTTAAGMLVTAAVGMTVGLRHYVLATGLTALTFIVLFALGWLKDKIHEKSGSKPVPAGTNPPAPADAPRGPDASP